ncbi:hypothetical protein [Aggregatibacter actinomycetemcomitans]|uniref:hypothetical protein n=1 Tax=Aggregatibacter actinomycetemcomitans TaxID=714 RepID=UPI0016527678|nr:hypothetical protein [Aggregatibacter actinomycetemcomitans]
MLTFRAIKGGATYYNFCPNQINISSDNNALDHFLEENQHKNHFFVYNDDADEIEMAFKERYFIENGIKKRFLLTVI